jgi:hypothetical protein
MPRERLLGKPDALVWGERSPSAGDGIDDDRDRHVPGNVTRGGGIGGRCQTGRRAEEPGCIWPFSSHNGGKMERRKK